MLLQIRLQRRILHQNGAFLIFLMSHEGTTDSVFQLFPVQLRPEVACAHPVHPVACYTIKDIFALSEAKEDDRG